MPPDAVLPAPVQENPQPGTLSERPAAPPGGPPRTPSPRLDPRRSARAAAVQVLVIFAGVTLSFIAEDQRESLGDHRTERRVLEGIATDLAVDSISVQWLANVHARATSEGLWLLAAWDRSNLPPDSLSRALLAFHRGGPYAPSRAEYESAKSAGRLQLISNPELRRRIVRHYEQGQPHHVRVNDIAIDFDFDLWRVLRPYLVLELAGDGRADGFASATLARPWPRLRDDPVVRNALTQTLFFRRLAASQLTAFQASGVELRALILEELAR